MSGFLVACVAALAAGALFILWLYEMKRVAMGKRLWLLNSLAAAAAVLGLAAFTREPGVLGGVMAGTGVLAGAAFLGLGLFLSAQSKQTPAVTVGAELLAFTAPDEDGKPFDIASLRGRPVLLKFFRGHW